MQYSLSDAQLEKIVAATEGYSCADLTAVVKDVAMGPLRDVPTDKILTMKDEDLRPITRADF